MVKNSISQTHLKRYIIGACGTNNPSCNNLVMYGSGDKPPPSPPQTCPSGTILYNNLGVNVCVPKSSLPPPTCPDGWIPNWTGTEWTCPS